MDGSNNWPEDAYVVKSVSESQKDEPKTGKFITACAADAGGAKEIDGKFERRL